MLSEGDYQSSSDVIEDEEIKEIQEIDPDRPHMHVEGRENDEYSGENEENERIHSNKAKIE